MSMEKRWMAKIKACPWCGWRNTTLWNYFDGRIDVKHQKPTEYSIHCNHCGYASKKSRFKWRTKWYWNHANVQFLKRKRYHIYGREF